MSELSVCTPSQHFEALVLTCTELLMPLTSAGALKEHPTLSVPYTSKALDEIISSAQEMVQREQNNLWRLKHLTNGLRGDTSYMPVGAFETESDASLMQQDTENTSQAPSADHRMDVDLPSPTNGEVEVQSKQDAQDVEFDPIGKPLKNLAAAEHGAILSQEQTSFEYGVAREDHEPEQLGHVNGVEEFKPEEVVAEVTKQADEAIHGDILQVGALSTITNPDQETTSNGFNVEQQDLNETTSKDFDPDRTEEMEDAPPHPNDGDENGEEGEGEGEDGDDETQRPHRMTTRAKAAEAAPSPTLSTSSQATHPPHPFFFLPPSILPSRDLGLPPHEAAETRRIMSAYIQKQEDAVTNSWKLLNGLLKARRWRDMVLEWCVSEGHVGEMSDGEDWYDREAWGLEGELKKGSEEMEGEEENGVGVGGRKGKTRRARGAAAG